jgi:hypothetical protein
MMAEEIGRYRLSGLFDDAITIADHLPSICYLVLILET